LQPCTLIQKDSATQVILLFKRYNLSAAAITIEVTEEQAFSDIETRMHNIKLRREFGCAITDDFGTGYDNYERLKSLQADMVKIDGLISRPIRWMPL
jgi:EAL domain-containing protein (putative c-di-GMP-specific phosphodiesterase class I)